MKLLARILGFYVNLLAYIYPKSAGHKAFEIFCTPRGGRFKEYQREFLQGGDPAPQGMPPAGFNCSEHLTAEDVLRILRRSRFSSQLTVLIGGNKHSTPGSTTFSCSM